MARVYPKNPKTRQKMHRCRSCGGPFRILLTSLCSPMNYIPYSDEYARQVLSGESTCGGERTVTPVWRVRQHANVGTTNGTQVSNLPARPAIPNFPTLPKKKRPSKPKHSRVSGSAWPLLVRPSLPFHRNCKALFPSFPTLARPRARSSSPPSPTRINTKFKADQRV